MASRTTVHNTMRTWHRYLGFFLAGIMAVYSLSGIVLIFRDTNFLKRRSEIVKTLKPHLTADQLKEALRMREVKFEPGADTVLRKFKQGSYNSETGEVRYTVQTLPKLMEKLTKLHKANSGDPLFFLNVFFGVSLFFFVLSSFWMFLPRTRIFRKGLIFSIAGIVLTLVMLLW